MIGYLPKAEYNISLNNLRTVNLRAIAKVEIVTRILYQDLCLFDVR